MTEFIYTPRSCAECVAIAVRAGTTLLPKHVNNHYVACESPRQRVL